MKHIILIACILLTAATEMYSQIKTEYFFDTDPGYGNAIQETTDVGENLLTLRTSQLDAGLHLLGMRTVDEEGRWSPTVTSPLYVFAPVTDISAAEWFIDTDPGEGMANIIETAGMGETTFVVPTSGLAEGGHSLMVRIMTSDGHWLPLSVTPFDVEIKEGTGIAEVKRNMDIIIRRTSDGVLLTRNDNTDSGMNVKIFTTDGIECAGAVWHAGMQDISLKVPQQYSPVIVTVTKNDGTRFVRLIK